MEPAGESLPSTGRGWNPWEMMVGALGDQQEMDRPLGDAPNQGMVTPPKPPPWHPGCAFPSPGVLQGGIPGRVGYLDLHSPVQEFPHPGTGLAAPHGHNLLLHSGVSSALGSCPWRQNFLSCGVFLNQGLLLRSGVSLFQNLLLGSRIFSSAVGSPWIQNLLRSGILFLSLEISWIQSLFGSGILSDLVSLWIQGLLSTEIFSSGLGFPQSWGLLGFRGDPGSRISTPAPDLPQHTSPFCACGL